MNKQGRVRGVIEHGIFETFPDGTGRLLIPEKDRPPVLPLPPPPPETPFERKMRLKGYKGYRKPPQSTLTRAFKRLFLWLKIYFVFFSLLQLALLWKAYYPWLDHEERLYFLELKWALREPQYFDVSQLYTVSSFFKFVYARPQEYWFWANFFNPISCCLFGIHIVVFLVNVCEKPFSMIKDAGHYSNVYYPWQKRPEWPPQEEPPPITEWKFIPTQEE